MVSLKSGRSHSFKKVTVAVLLQDATKAFQIGPAQSSLADSRLSRQSLLRAGIKTLTGAVG